MSENKDFRAVTVAVPDAERQSAATLEVLRYGILNPWGGLWSADTFWTEEQALDHLARFWAKQPEHNRGFRVVPVRLSVVALSAEPLGTAGEGFGAAEIRTG